MVGADSSSTPDAAGLPRQPALQLVLGPARSGKSRWAEQLALLSRMEIVYVATGPSSPLDEAWQQRVRRHRQRRPPTWTTVELGEPDHLGRVLLGLSAQQLALVDSLGTWVAAGLDLDQQQWDGRCETLLTAVDSCSCCLVLVSEQTGWGVVPPTAIGGLFRDRLGALERRLVAIAERAWLVVAGRAVNLTAIGQSVPLD
jgi:adenosylcobinamide kinase/adenosylcobinamide-phosphate guanylyltransferase